ncbi:MAG: high-affinity nickel-transporter, partial [Dehalococcoidia bacterium]
MTLHRSLRPLALTIVLLAAALALLTATKSADAHPLGNFTVNRYTRIEVYADAVRLHYVLDMAEIPTFQEFGDIDTDGDGEINPGENQAYASGEAEDLLKSAQLTIDGSPVQPSVRTTNLIFPEGQGGLDTLRLTFTADVPA